MSNGYNLIYNKYHCNASLCNNRGECSEKADKTGFTCQCTDDFWTGDRCENVNECADGENILYMLLLF